MKKQQDLDEYLILEEFSQGIFPMLSVFSFNMHTMKYSLFLGLSFVFFNFPSDIVTYFLFFI